MRYVKNTIWNRQLPSYLGIFVLLLAVGITVVLSRNTVFFVTKATVGSEPKNLQISNVTANSFTISFTTDEAVIGYIAFGANSQISGIVKDVRDQTAGSTQGEYRVHYFKAENLTPATQYVFAITSDIQITEQDKDGKPFTVTTAPQAATPSAQTELKGSVALADGGYPTEGIVTLSSPSTQTLTALVQPDGSYRFPLSQLRTTSLDTYASLVSSLTLDLDVTNGTATASASVTADQKEVPQIILGQNYDFAAGKTITSDAPASGSGVASESADFPIFEVPKPVTEPEITIPSLDQKFTDPRPTFKGRALASTPVSLVIEAEKEISAELQSDSLGVWEFQPPLDLEAGNHSVTIQSADSTGATKTVTREFTVLADGSQFIEPSVSPYEIPATPTIDPRTLTPTAAPTATPSATPTIDPNATMSGTITPTRGPLNPTGSSTAVMGVITSVLFLASGVILFFLIAV